MFEKYVATLYGLARINGNIVNIEIITDLIMVKTIIQYKKSKIKCKVHKKNIYSTSYLLEGLKQNVFICIYTNDKRNKICSANLKGSICLLAYSNQILLPFDFAWRECNVNARVRTKNKRNKSAIMANLLNIK